MTRPLFLTGLEGAAVGDTVSVAGEEGHHAVAVKRLRVGEPILLSDGHGRAVNAVVQAVGKREFSAEVVDVIQPKPCPWEWTVVQALAKGDRSEIAVQTATELGARRIIAWQAARSIVRWQGERGEKSLDKWRSIAREAAKQARRFHVPSVSSATSEAVAALIGSVDVALVLHEDATEHIAAIELPATGTGLVIVGPEGGITDEELNSFLASGARSVTISDGVLRTSTAGAVALGQLDVVARQQ